MDITTLSKRSGIKYYTLRRYTQELKARGIDPTEAIIPMVQEIYRLTGTGMTIKKAVDHVLTREEVGDPMTRMESKINELQKENQALNQLVQVYLSKIDTLQDAVKALPKPSDTTKEVWEKTVKRLDQLEALIKYRTEKTAPWYKTLFKRLFKR